MRRVLGLMIIFLVAHSMPALAEQKWALLVGVDQYQSPDVTPLRCAVRDVKALRNALVRFAGFPEDNVFVLTSDQSGDGAPTKAKVAFRLGWLEERVQPGDTVVFFFSGHGMQMDEDNFLLTSDADPGNAVSLEMTGFRCADVQKHLKELRARALVVILDACRSDPRSGKGAGANNTLTQQMSRDLVVQKRENGFTTTIFACQEGQRSYEWADRGHGFFTWFLLEALSGKAADAQGRLTVASLHNYLDAEVSKAAERATGNKQVPLIKSYGAPDSEAVIATVKPGSVDMVDSGVGPSKSTDGRDLQKVKQDPQPTPAPVSYTPPTTHATGFDSGFTGTWYCMNVPVNGVRFNVVWAIEAGGQYTQTWYLLNGKIANVLHGTLTTPAPGRWQAVLDSGQANGGSYKLMGTKFWMSNDQMGLSGEWHRKQF